MENKIDYTVSFLNDLASVIMFGEGEAIYHDLKRATTTEQIADCLQRAYKEYKEEGNYSDYFPSRIDESL